jgi:WD40 repeat protein
MNRRSDPYPGLRPFRREDHEVFFGRDDEVEDLLTRLADHHFLAIIGPSGCGKSSLVGAGLIPMLQGANLGEPGSTWVVATVKRPGVDAMAELARSLAACFEMKLEEVTKALARSALGLTELAQTRLKPRQKLFVLVDQFEELIRYRGNSAERRTQSVGFVKMLLAAAGRDELSVEAAAAGQVFIALTMRSEYLGRCGEFYGLPEALNESQYLVPRMSRDQLREAIEGPALLREAAVSPVLVQRLLSDISDDPDQLPLLQHALHRVWEEAPRDVLDLETYESPNIGTVSRALDLDADAVYDRLKTEPHRAIARRTFQRLVEWSADAREARRATPLSEIVAINDPAPEKEVLTVIDVFRERGFLTLSNDEDPIVDIPHESLIRLWTRLGGWVREESESARLYQQLADNAARSGFRYRGRQLAEAVRWREREAPNAAWAARYTPDHKDAFPKALEFLTRNRRLQCMEVTGVALACALAVVFFWLFRTGREERVRDRKIAQLTREARWELQRHPDRIQESALMDIAALRLGPASEAERELRDALKVMPLPVARFDVGGPVASFAVDDSGTYIAAYAGVSELLVFKREDPKRPPKRLSHNGEHLWYSFSPGGKFIATLCSDQAVRVWDPESGSLAFPPIQQNGAVNALAFDPSGTMFAFGGDDFTVHLVDLRTGKPLGLPLRHTKPISRIVFSKTGDLLASAGDDGVGIWDRKTGRKVYDGSTNTVAFAEIDSPLRRTLLFGGYGGPLHVWDMIGARAHHELEAKRLTQVLVRDDIVIGETDQDRWHLWSVSRGSEKGSPPLLSLDMPQLPPGSRIADILPKAGSNLVASIMSRGAQIFSAEPGKAPKEWARAEHSDDVTAVRLLPGGPPFFVTGGRDDFVRIWRAPPDPDLPGARPLASSALNRDGSLLASYDSGQIQLFSAPFNGAPVPVSSTVRPESLIFDWDTRRLAATSAGPATVFELHDLSRPTTCEWDFRPTHYVLSKAYLIAAAGATPGRGGKPAVVAACDLKTGKLTNRAELTAAKKIDQLLLTPDESHILVRTGAQKVTIWPTSGKWDPEHAAQLSGNPKFIAVSPGSRYAAACIEDNPVLEIINLSDSTLSSRKLAGPCSYVAFSSDGSKVAIAMSSEIDIRSFPGWAAQQALPDAADDVAFSQDGKLIVASDRVEHTTRIWNVEDASKLTEMGFLVSPQFTRDSRFLHTSSALVPWQPADLIDAGCARITRILPTGQTPLRCGSELADPTPKPSK